MSIYDFKVTARDGSEVSLAAYSGKVLLIINTDPLFRYLSENTAFQGFGKSPMTLILSGVAKKMDKDYKDNGEIVARFEPTASMKEVKAKVEALL